MKKLKTWQVALLILFYPAGIVYLIVKLTKKIKSQTQNNNYHTHYNPDNVRIDDLYSENERLKKELRKAQDEIQFLKRKTSKSPEELSSEVQAMYRELEALEKKQKTALNKLNKITEIYKSMDYATQAFYTSENYSKSIMLSQNIMQEVEALSPSVILKLHSMDIKELQKAFRKNDKDIQSVLTAYVGRYTTKANKCIYQLMVIALRSELQNILVDLKYEKLDVAIEKVQSMTAKYLAIAGEGNQNIVGTLTKFISQVEYLFINAVKIEYNYYVKKEQARQEQLAIREQMRIEAQERKALEEEKKKIEKEESKYTDEIEKVKAQLASANEEEIRTLNARISELQAQLASVVLKKDEIIKLQNGKAGNIYIISNLGSFGEDVFKIGMTRRSEPQERVNELGDASVPFRFDVHSFIFSDDAVELETRLHTILDNKRVNKVNRRKEFFRISLDELEQLVRSIDPTAEFNKTMAAEEFRQSLSCDEVYTSDYVTIGIDED